MGKFIKGILGGFSGKVGNVIGAYWRGIDYMRSLPRKSTRPPTEAQSRQRMIFGLVAAFLRPISSLINVGFQQYKGSETPLNAASSYHLENAITGVYPSLSIDFTKVMFSKGILPEVFDPEAATSAAAEIDFTWQDNVPPSADLPDKLTVLVYNPAKNLFVKLAGAALRTAETFTLNVPANFSGDQVHCWLSFVSDDGKSVSDSIYVGVVSIV